jgi:hypothetical protein
MPDEFNLPPPFDKDDLAFNQLLACVEMEEHGGYYPDMEYVLAASEYVFHTATPVFELDGETGAWRVVADPLSSETVPARRYFGRVVSIDLHPFVNSVDFDAYLESAEAKLLMERITTGFSLTRGFETGWGAARVWGQLDRDATIAADALRWSFEIRQFTDRPGLETLYDEVQV